MRTNRLLTFHGTTRCLQEWSEVTGLSASCISKRINELGWSAEEALTLPRQRPNGRRRKGRKQGWNW
jgi:hypothetical protein